MTRQLQLGDLDSMPDFLVPGAYLGMAPQEIWQGSERARILDAYRPPEVTDSALVRMLVARAMRKAVEENPDPGAAQRRKRKGKAGKAARVRPRAMHSVGLRK